MNGEITNGLLPGQIRFLGEAMAVVEDHLSERDFSVSQLSNLLGMSRVTLHRRLKSITNLSAGAFIRFIRLDYAAEVLRTGDCSVHEAARQSGFYNQSYFSKCFREKFGCRPSEFFGRGA